MKQRYFLIEPDFFDGDTFSRFTVGCDRVRASIRIYADEHMLSEIARALTAPVLLPEELSMVDIGYPAFDLRLSVLPANDGFRVLRCQVFDDWENGECAYRADIRLMLSAEEASELSAELMKWLQQRNYALVWKGG